MTLHELPPLRIGYGYDVHAFADGRPLILGGVPIEHPRGLAGHSDADVLLHAITDALLGALAWGDIGRWFPNTDERYRGVASTELFCKVWQECAKHGWRLVNCDCVVVAERPRLAEHLPRICDSIGRLFAVEADRVSVKAKTTERLGSIGREEGMAAHATVLLYRARP